MRGNSFKKINDIDIENSKNTKNKQLPLSLNQFLSSLFTFLTKQKKEENKYLTELTDKIVSKLDNLNNTIDKKDFKISLKDKINTENINKEIVEEFIKKYDPQIFNILRDKINNIETSVNKMVENNTGYVSSTSSTNPVFNTTTIEQLLNINNETLNKLQEIISSNFDSKLSNLNQTLNNYLVNNQLVNYSQKFIDISETLQSIDNKIKNGLNLKFTDNISDILNEINKGVADINNKKFEYNVVSNNSTVSNIPKNVNVSNNNVNVSNINNTSTYEDKFYTALNTFFKNIIEKFSQQTPGSQPAIITTIQEKITAQTNAQQKIFLDTHSLNEQFNKFSQSINTFKSIIDRIDQREYNESVISTTNSNTSTSIYTVKPEKTFSIFERSIINNNQQTGSPAKTDANLKSVGVIRTAKGSYQDIKTGDLLNEKEVNRRLSVNAEHSNLSFEPIQTTVAYKFAPTESSLERPAPSLKTVENTAAKVNNAYFKSNAEIRSEFGGFRYTISNKSNESPELLELRKLTSITSKIENDMRSYVNYEIDKDDRENLYKDSLSEKGIQKISEVFKNSNQKPSDISGSAKYEDLLNAIKSR